MILTQLKERGEGQPHLFTTILTYCYNYPHCFVLQEEKIKCSNILSF